MLIDILFSVATIGFVLSDIRQFTKLRKTKHPTNALSRSHYKLKFFSLSCMIVAYAMSQLYLSLSISALEFVLNIGIIIYIYNGRV